MVEFTPEQEAEIALRIEKAKQEQNTKTQYNVSVLTAYKACIPYLAELVDQFDKDGNLIKRGTFDQAVLINFQNEFVKFLATAFPKQAAPESKEPADEDPAE